MRRILFLLFLLALCVFSVTANNSEDIGELPLMPPSVIAQIIVITPATVIDFQGLANSPGNPPSGKGRVYFNSSTGQLACLTSTGTSCSGGGITQVTSLPATCTATSGPVQLTATAGYAPIYTCQNGVYGIAGLMSGGTTIDATQAPYSVVPGNAWLDATWTSGSNNVTIGSSDAPFTSTMNGWACGGTSGPVSGTNSDFGSVLVKVIGSFTFSTATSGTCSGTAANASASGTNNGVLVVAPDMTSQVLSAWQAATGGSGTGGESQCYNVQWPSGVIFVKSFPWNSLNCNNSMTGATSAGAWNFGWGRTSTRFVPEFDAFNWASAVSYGGISALAGGHNGINWTNLAIWGAGYEDTSAAKGQNAGGAHNVVAVACGADSQLNGVEMLDWGGADTGAFIGLDAVGVGCSTVFNSTIAYGFVVACQADATLNWEFGECGPSKGGTSSSSGSLVINGGTLNSMFMVVFESQTGTGQVVECRGTWSSVADNITAASGAEGINADAGCNAHISGLTVSGGIAIAGSSTGKATVTASNITGVNTSFNPVSLNSTSSFRSGSGNTFNCASTTAPIQLNATTATVILDSTDVFSGCTNVYATNNIACTFTSGGGSTPSCALQAGSTDEKGVIIASTGTGSPGSTGTVTLTFAGTYTGPTGGAPVCTYTLDNSGTAWGNEALVFVSTQSTTAPVLAWTNLASGTLTALAASSPYRIGYSCPAR